MSDLDRNQNGFLMRRLIWYFILVHAQDIEIKPFALLMHVRFTPHGALTHTKKCSLIKHEILF